MLLGLEKKQGEPKNPPATFFAIESLYMLDKNIIGTPQIKNMGRRRAKNTTRLLLGRCENAIVSMPSKRILKKKEFRTLYHTKKYVL